MNRDPNLVAIILDDEYPELRATSQQMAIWAVDTPANRATMTELWAGAKAPSNDLTLFKTATGVSKDLQLLSKVPTIELHHPDARVLLLIGVGETPALRDGFLELGYSLKKRGDDLLAIKTDTRQ